MLRTWGRALLGLCLALLLIAAIWLVCNLRWADDEATALPSALQPRVVTLAPERNAFFAAEVGRRCESLAAAKGFEEPVRELQSEGPLADTPAAEYPLPQFGGLGLCMRWFAVEAVLAKNPGQARPHWQRGNALMRLANAGSQSLLGQVLGWSWAEKQWLLLSQWAADLPPGVDIDPAWGAQLSPGSLTPRIWMASEHLHQRLTLLELIRTFERRHATATHAFAAWFNRQTPGWLPSATLHELEAQWLAEIEVVGEAQGAELARRALSRPPAKEVAAWRTLTWRNPVGSFLNQGTKPDFRPYLARQADLVLLQAALRLALAMDAIAPAERAQWLAHQALDDELRRRLTLESEALVVRSWRSEVDPERAKPLRLSLRPA